MSVETGSRIICLRAQVSRRRVIALQFPGLLLSNGFCYLWLFVDYPLFFRLWGFSILPVFLAAVIVPLASMKLDLRAGFRPSYRRVGAYVLAFVLPLLLFGLAVVVESLSGGKLNTSWEWTSLALSSLADLPVTYIWVLPMTVSQELAWRRAVDLTNRNGTIRKRTLLSSGFWIGTHIVFLLFCFLETDTLRFLQLFLLLLSAGVFTYRLQAWGGVMASALALLSLLILHALVFGSDLHALNTILFGFDVETVPALVSVKSEYAIWYRFAIPLLLVLVSQLFPDTWSHTRESFE